MRNHFLTPSRTALCLTALAVAVGMLASASVMAGDPVYKWKDSSGQSHYSQTPPDGIKYETITTAGASTTAGKPASGNVAASNRPTAAPANGGQGYQAPSTRSTSEPVATQK